MKNHRTIRKVLTAALVLGLLWAASSATASPARRPDAGTMSVDSKITYQGVLTDSGGDPLSGTYNFKFELYGAAAGGTKLWEQTKNGVPVQDGLLNVALDVAPEDFDGQALWLAITVDGQLLSPRQELSPVPYAMSVRPGAVIDGDLTDSALTVNNQGGVSLWASSDADTAIVGLSSSSASPNNAVTGVNEGTGAGVRGFSAGGYGVSGETEDDTEWEAAGVYGYSTHDRTFGVLGESEWGIAVEGGLDNPDNTNPAVVGYNSGGGPGVEGYSVNDAGVKGTTEDDAEYEAAGVHGHSTHENTSGVMGTSEFGFGVYGQITNLDNTQSAVIGYNAGQGKGVTGYSLHSYGVLGETDDDTEYEAAGVYGYSTHDRTFGVLGESEWGIGVEGRNVNPDNTNPAVVGYNSGGGSGVVGYSFNETGVKGTTESAASYGGSFVNVTSGGAGLYAAGADEADADLVLGGEPGADDGVIASEPSEPGSDIVLLSNDAVVAVLDQDDDEEGHFAVVNGTDEVVFRVDESGNTEIEGDLIVDGDFMPAGVQYDVSTAGQHVVDVPGFCKDSMCVVLMSWKGGAMGAFNPGILWPVYYMQETGGNTWVGGPSLSIAGVTLSSGYGVNGDGHADWVVYGGQTAGGGYVRLLDDSAAENSPNQWTIDFAPLSGELDSASYYICPVGNPIASP